MKRIFTPTKKTTILIIDDDPVVVHIYREKLQSQGFKVEVAGDGEGALQRLGETSVDLVILDLCLPGMNGVEVLRNIRSGFDRQTLPVIVFSNSYLSSQERVALEEGATKCVSKAESTPGLIAGLVRELLAPAQTSAAVSRDVVNESMAEPVAAEFPELIAGFLMSSPAALAKLRAGLQLFTRAEEEEARRAELEGMHRLVRSLAASSGLIGFQKISQMANALEALLIELQAKPQKVTPSVIRTIAQAIDTLASLFDHAGSRQDDAFLAPRILVVDDEIISRETICSALGKAGLTAAALDDSLAAQRLLEQECFDLIFLDVEMPGLNGFELCVKIREMETNRATPVVFVTAHSDFGRRAQSSLSGGNDFIAKPFLLVELAVKTLTCLFKGTVRPSSSNSLSGAQPLSAGEGDRASREETALASAAIS